MTTLGSKIVYNGRGCYVKMDVSGDLSYGYRVVPHSKPYSLGYTFANKKDAIAFTHIIQKYGYASDKIDSIYNKKRSRQHFKYLPYKMAKPYLRDAYGDVAEKYKKRAKKKR